MAFSTLPAEIIEGVGRLGEEFTEMRIRHGRGEYGRRTPRGPRRRS